MFGFISGIFIGTIIGFFAMCLARAADDPCEECPAALVDRPRRMAEEAAREALG